MTKEIEKIKAIPVEAVDRKIDIGLHIPFFFGSIGVPGEAICVTRKTNYTGTRSYIKIELHPKETGKAGLLLISDAGNFADIEYEIDRPDRRGRNPYPMDDGMQIEKILASHTQSNDAPRYTFGIDRESGTTQLIYRDCRSGSLLDPMHRFVGLQFTPELADESGRPLGSLVGSVQLLAVPARRSRLALASGMPSD